MNNIDLLNKYIATMYHYDDADAADMLDVALITDSTDSPIFATVPVIIAHDYSEDAEEGDYLITERDPDGQQAEIVRVMDGAVVMVWANC